MSAVPESVFERVDDLLTDLERDRGIRVALAVARGSHAWGAASPESDYDVGFVFVPDDLRRYAHLAGPPETIHEAVDTDDGDVELQGWDVRTFARLLADSNDGAIDLLRSPIRYRVAYEPMKLAAYVERTYNPMDLYHAWRGIATSNYRKYISHHLVRTDDAIFPILEAREDEYVVETRGEEEADELDVDDGTRTIPIDDERFTETQTKPTVKRNLTIYRAAMSARYLKATGERDGHELPVIEFDRFLDEQAPSVFDDERIERARALLERKWAGDGSEPIGDAVGREFAHPPHEIDPGRHAHSGPDPKRLDEFVDELIAAVR
ncbi:Nucleotidyltransferase, predicted [Haloterrigena turkmenica DSM 5511]|uniref:Nucleotidyltransferase, predicted n=1 Tax=Haloterrigena turkmenica (strain ATCC 51198 / DSM 5511 / JCM 9101 / NCIMB 13204 / VKM B-1734 / 4k) TaxID=543526 RepID=D2RVM1_HALTV|nr:nucleotidyltransferase domain-containing protein [Haloterrigena turkmenica]ADB59385.1 Nucleotidyltransferase, predicted [Haloterrigena turkmenica DSM 5511]